MEENPRHIDLTSAAGHRDFNCRRWIIVVMRMVNRDGTVEKAASSIMLHIDVDIFSPLVARHIERDQSCGSSKRPLWLRDTRLFNVFLLSFSFFFFFLFHIYCFYSETVCSDTNVMQCPRIKAFQRFNFRAVAHWRKKCAQTIFSLFPRVVFSHGRYAKPYAWLIARTIRDNTNNR